MSTDMTQALIKVVTKLSSSPSGTYSYDDVEGFGTEVLSKSGSNTPPDGFLNVMVDCLFKVANKAKQSKVKETWISGCKRVSWGDPMAVQAAKRMDANTQQSIDDFLKVGRKVKNVDVYVRFWLVLYLLIVDGYDQYITRSTPPKLENTSGGEYRADVEPTFQLPDLEENPAYQIHKWLVDNDNLQPTGTKGRKKKKGLSEHFDGLKVSNHVDRYLETLHNKSVL